MRGFQDGNLSFFGFFRAKQSFYALFRIKILDFKSQKCYNKTDMKKILTYFKPYKWQSLMGPLLKLAEATFELLVPFVVAAIVDNGFGA